MQRTIRIHRVFCLSVVLVMGLTTLAEAQNRVRAKVGMHVKSSHGVAWAKAQDSIQAGDFLRVYVLPEEDAYIYLVYTDKQKPILLNNQTYKKKINKSTITVFPSESEFYQTDGTNPFESFTVICSPSEIPEIPQLLNSPHASHEKWALLEANLVRKSKIDISQKLEKPFSIAGNVRGPSGEANYPSLVNELLVFSGESFLVKKYEFAVKK